MPPPSKPLRCMAKKGAGLTNPTIWNVIKAVPVQRITIWRQATRGHRFSNLIQKAEYNDYNHRDDPIKERSRGAVEDGPS